MSGSIGAKDWIEIVDRQIVQQRARGSAATSFGRLVGRSVRTSSIDVISTGNDVALQLDPSISGRAECRVRARVRVVRCSSSACEARASQRSVGVEQPWHAVRRSIDGLFDPCPPDVAEVGRRSRLGDAANHLGRSDQRVLSPAQRQSTHGLARAADDDAGRSHALLSDHRAQLRVR